MKLSIPSLFDICVCFGFLTFIFFSLHPSPLIVLTTGAQRNSAYISVITNNSERQPRLSIITHEIQRVKHKIEMNS